MLFINLKNIYATDHIVGTDFLNPTSNCSESLHAGNNHSGYCGGAGTRLWPVSRETMPKQFVPLSGQGSTFQQVMGRISDPGFFARPIVITNSDFRFIVAEQLRECG